MAEHSGSEDFAEFVLEDARISDKKIGKGTYGKTYEIFAQGQCYVGKVFHRALWESANLSELTRKYYQACKTLSSLDHPNVESFIGVCHHTKSRLPVLVVEKFDKSLEAWFGKKETRRTTTLAVIAGFLKDIASGLNYLHSQNPPIIHGHLMATNIMLTSDNNAIIVDISDNQILPLEPASFQKEARKYMPPEPASAVSRKRDIFSFGHLALYIALKGYHGDLKEDATEVERRVHYFKCLKILLPEGEEHPLVQLIEDCLKNDLLQRPTAKQVLQRIELIQRKIMEWDEKLKKQIVLAVVGEAGSGKSTLVNNVLGLKGKHAAPTGESVESITTKVEVYSNPINEVTISMVDIPGFESDLTDEQEDEVIEKLSKHTPDVLLYCIKLNVRLDIRRAKKIIEKVNRTFEKKDYDIWKHLVLVLTHADLIDKNKLQLEKEKVVTHFGKAFGEIKPPVGTVWSTEAENQPMEHFINDSIVIAVPVGISPNKPSNWLRPFNKAILKKCHTDAIPALHANYNVGAIAAAVIGGSFGAGIVGGGVGAGVGSGVGAGIGAIAGASLGAAAGGVGAAPGAAIGAATGAWIGAVVGTSTIGSGSLLGAAIFGSLKGAALYQEIAEINSIIAERYKQIM